MASTRQPLSRALLQTQTSFYICRSCRSRVSHARISEQPSRGYASKDTLPFTEKLRRKIWGTDNPPGLADPYGGPSFLEKRKMRREAAAQQAARGSSTEGSGSHEYETEIPFSNDTAAEDLSVAPVEDTPLEEYRPAETWIGLEHIGSTGDWRDQMPEEKDQYEQFLLPEGQRVMTRRDLVSCLHRSIVEVLLLQEARVKPSIIFSNKPSAVDSTAYAAITIHTSASGPWKLAAASEGEKMELVKKIQARRSSQGNLGARLQGVQHYTVSDQSFLSAPLNLKETLKLTILKRFTQLSGHRIPDYLLTSTLLQNPQKPYSALIDQLYISTVTPKPQNLAQKLMSTSTLSNRPNVMVLPRRETPVDKEKEVGRWKVIERELQDRGLPVLGRLETLREEQIRQEMAARRSA